MAFDLKKITNGVVERSIRALLYGGDGVGKSTFASGAPDPFFVDPNKGRYRLRVRGTDIEDWTEFRACLDAIEGGKIPCKTIVLDAITNLEAMCGEKLFPGVSIKEARGGFKAGEGAVVLEWRNVVAQLERMWLGGKHVLLIGHVVVRRFNDPAGPSYDRSEVSCSPELGGFLKQWSDYVLFAREDVTMAGKRTATTTGARWVQTNRSPAWDAKARGTNLFPAMLPLSWNAFFEAVQNDTARGATMLKEIDAMLAEIGDEALSKQVLGYIKEYPTQLVDGYNRLVIRLEEHRKAKAPAGQEVTS
jgi:hypothetical protein